MPPVSVDTITQDDANRMARAQLFRRLSANSSNASTNSKRARKGVKVNGAGTSPHSIQRRRTTAAHPTRNTFSVSHDHHLQGSGQQRGSSQWAHNPLPSARPMSWHPGSRGYETSSEPFPAAEPIMKNTIAGFENLTVNITPSSNDHPPPTSLPADPSFCMTNYSASYRPCVSTMEGYYQIDGAGPDGTAYSAYPMPGQMVFPIPPYSDYGYPSMDPQGGWPQPLVYSDFPAPQTPDFLPIQYPPEPSQSVSVDPSPPIVKKQSKELVGMGLYDCPAQDSISSLDLLARFSDHRESMGKGLKLEETWQPPKETDEEEDEAEEEAEDEEEAYSTDEADEDVLPIVTPSSDAEAPAAFYPAYGDLSNQTFFFDDDPFASCIAFQAIHECRQPKVPEADYGASEHLYF
ncbi:hypothetical protein MMC07_000532 [Pseudocyphellaria aurata]|nr:hypothetical protein [Pseudocyphellaria aurata]